MHIIIRESIIQSEKKIRMSELSKEVQRKLTQDARIWRTGVFFTIKNLSDSDEIEPYDTYGDYMDEI